MSHFHRTIYLEAYVAKLVYGVHRCPLYMEGNAYRRMSFGIRTFNRNLSTPRGAKADFSVLGGSQATKPTITAQR